MAQQLTNPTRIHGHWGSIPGLWLRPGAVTPIQPLARELQYVADATLKKEKKKQNKTKKKNLNFSEVIEQRIGIGSLVFCSFSKQLLRRAV